jgi:hypothetical protein
MARYSPGGSVTHWLTFNALMHAARAVAPRYLRVHYEDFARAPEPSVRRVLAWIGEGTAPLFGMDGHTLAVGIDHTASGNPMRFEQGAVTIKPDEEWRTRMTGRDRRLVTLGTLPLLLAYGYVRPRWRSRLHANRPVSDPRVAGGTDGAAPSSSDAVA